MAFNQVVKDMKTSGDRFGVFNANVKVRYFTGSNPIAFRIAPAYRYVQQQDGTRVPESQTACDPFRLQNGEFTEWGNQIQLMRSVGHGRDFKSGARKDVLSPKTFDPDAFCPLSELYHAAAQYPEWQYLIEDQKGPDGKQVIQRAALSRISKLLIMNVVDVGDPQVSGIVQVGVFSKSASDSLFGENGLAVAPGMAQPQQIEQNYLLRWAYGDITDPQYGPVLLLMRAQGQGQFSKYHITVATDSQQNVKRWPLNEQYLAGRYDMANLPSIVAKDTDEQIIGQLCQLLNMRSPHGRHEWHLLKDVFGHMARIPDPPENAPAATPTVQSGFQAPQGMAPAGAPAYGPQPAAGPMFAPPGAPPAGVAPYPAVTTPGGGPTFGTTAGAGVAPPAGSPPQVQYQPQPGPQAAPPAQYQPQAAPQAQQAPVQSPPPVQYAPPPVAAAVGPAAQAGQPAPQAGPVFAQPPAEQSAAQPAAYPVQQQPAQAAPVAPGDSTAQEIVPGTSQTRSQFLDSLKQ